MAIETKIHVNGKPILLKFSFMTIREIEKEGYSITNLQETMKSDYTGLIISIVKAGAKVAVKSKEDVISEDEIIDWIDENGFLSEAVQNVVARFTENLTEGVPKNEIAVKPQRVKKVTPPKK